MTPRPVAGGVLYQWYRSNPVEQVCGLEARLRASVTPELWQEESCTTGIGPTQWNRCVG